MEEPKIITDQEKGITGTLISEILEAVKLLNNVENSSMDSIITYYIKAVCNGILIKTNRRMFVPELKYIVIDLVGNKLMTRKVDNGADDLGSIQSMSEAGRSVSFGTTDVLRAKLDLLAQKQLDENEALINKYKLLYKT